MLVVVRDEFCRALAAEINGHVTLQNAGNFRRFECSGFEPDFSEMGWSSTGLCGPWPVAFNFWNAYPPLHQSTNVQHDQKRVYRTTRNFQRVVPIIVSTDNRQFNGHVGGSQLPPPPA